MRRQAAILITMVLLVGCMSASRSTDEYDGLRDIQETQSFEIEYVAMAATRLPGEGTPCGGVTIGYANGLGDEWDLPAWAQTISVRLESDALLDPLSYRLCLVHEDGGEEASRGRVPLELHTKAKGNTSVILAAYPDEEIPSPHGPKRLSIVAIVRGRA